MRKVEMYVGLYEGNAQTWFTHIIEIPFSTPENMIEETAKNAMLAELEKNPSLHVAFVGVYHIPERDQE